MKDNRSISDFELHAYIDGQLDAEQHREIEAALVANEELRERLEAYLAINRSLHHMYDSILDEAIPRRLHVNATRRPYGLAASVAGVFFILGSLFGWQTQLQLAQSDTRATEMNLVQPAAFAHSVYTMDVAHPVEVSASNHQHLDNWLSKRLKTTLHAPDLSHSGYSLIGGRLLPSTEDRMAAQYMYESQQGQRITLYVRRGNWKPDDNAFSFSQEKGYSMFYWIDDDMGYVLTSQLQKATHQKLAQEVYRQMNLNSAKI